MPHSVRQDFFRTTDGAELFFHVEGEGTPEIIMCDGLGCDGFAWRYLLPRVSQTHRVLRWHYRGHGRSTLPHDSRRVGMTHIIDDLVQLMDEVAMPRAVLLGHSMGVQVALELHRLHPERVLGLGLICGSYGNPLDTIHDQPLAKKLFPLIHGLVETFPKPIASLTSRFFRTELALQLGISLELNRRRLKRADMLSYFEHMTRMDPLVFMRTLADLAEHSAWDHLPRVNVPTLVIAGGQDKFTPSWLSRRMAAAIPDADLLVLDEGTHTTPLEYPDAVEEHVLRLLSVCLPKADRV